MNRRVLFLTTFLVFLINFISLNASYPIPKPVSSTSEYDEADNGNQLPAWNYGALIYKAAMKAVGPSIVPCDEFETGPVILVSDKAPQENEDNLHLPNQPTRQINTATVPAKNKVAIPITACQAPTKK